MALELTGSIDITTGAAFTDQDGRYSGSFSGSFVGDGSGLTGVSVGGSSDFPYTGSAIISGSLEVEGSVTIISGSLRGQGSGLTEVNPFPYEGQADIIGALKVDGAGEFNYLSSSNGVWSTAAAMNEGRNNLSGAGTQNAALAFGSFPGPSSTGTGRTEAFDGTAWNVKALLNSGLNARGGAGTQNAALTFGGGGQIASPSPIFRWNCTEKYDGNTWSNVNGLNTARSGGEGNGTQNAAITAGGEVPSSTISCTEEYNGNTWSETTALNNSRSTHGFAGSQNAALAFGGSGPGYPHATLTEEYNGSTWSEVTPLNTRRAQLTGTGIQNAALAVGGNDGCSPNQNNYTEMYNGISWSTVSTLNTGRYSFASSGTHNSALAFGGIVPPVLSSTATEEYNADACYRKHFYTQQNTVYADQLYVSGSSTVEAVFNLANRTDTPSPLTAGTVWQSGSAGAGCLYFTPDGTSICKISFA